MTGRIVVTLSLILIVLIIYVFNPFIAGMVACWSLVDNLPTSYRQVTGKLSRKTDEFIKKKMEERK